MVDESDINKNRCKQNQKTFILIALTYGVLEMNGYTVAMAKRDFSMGFVDGFSIERVPMGLGWVAVLKVAGRRLAIADARTKKPRHFKSLDAAVSLLESIGFSIPELR